VGKPFDDLKLNFHDVPTHGQPELSDEAKVFLSELHELLDDEGYQWAWPTIAGIRDTVEQLGRVSPGQRTAIDNICRGQAQRRGLSRSWRYEGWSRD